MVDGSLMVEWGVVDGWLMLIVVTAKTLMVSKVSWKSMGIIVIVTSPEFVTWSIDIVFLGLWLLSSWLGSWLWSSRLWSWLSSWLWSSLSVNWGVVERSGVKSTVSGGIEMSLIVVEVLGVVDWLFTGVVVTLIGVVNWVVGGVSVWVVGIVVILYPLVSVNEFVLIVIVGVIVLIWLELAVLPVVGE